MTGGNRTGIDTNRLSRTIRQTGWYQW